MACDCCDERDIVIPQGDDGVGISSITVNGSNQLVITYTNGVVVTTSALTITDAGSIILHKDNTAETTDVYTSGIPTQVGTKTYTVPINTLSTDGSELRVRATLTKTITNVGARDRIWIYVNNAWFVATTTYPGAESIYTGASTHKIVVEMIISRDTNTKANVLFKGSITGRFGTAIANGISEWHVYNPAPLGVFNFTTTTIPIAVFAQSFNSTDVNITCDSLVVEKILK